MTAVIIMAAGLVLIVTGALVVVLSWAVCGPDHQRTGWRWTVGTWADGIGGALAVFGVVYVGLVLMTTLLGG